MDAPKKPLQATSALPRAGPKPIRLKPSTTDYATFVRTTAKVLGTTGPAEQKTKLNKRLLSLMKSGPGGGTWVRGRFLCRGDRPPDEKHFDPLAESPTRAFDGPKRGFRTPFGPMPEGGVGYLQLWAPDTGVQALASEP